MIINKKKDSKLLNQI